MYDDAVQKISLFWNASPVLEALKLSSILKTAKSNNVSNLKSNAVGPNLHFVFAPKEYPTLTSSVMIAALTMLV